MLRSIALDKDAASVVIDVRLSNNVNVLVRVSNVTIDDSARTLYTLYLEMPQFEVSDWALD